MDEPFVTIDLHGKTTTEAVGVVGRALANAGSGVYQLRLIHGYNRGTKIRDIIYEWYRYDPKVKRILPGDNPGITILVLREL
ncbi:MAG: Smr/MutS family protein [Lachnospiraceae bacterium]|nr:Smr/MutS family protein [Lachnospiraceae bacterium]